MSEVSYCSLQRDRGLLAAAVLAGMTFPVDRHALAEELGFAAPSSNRIDAVSDRDFAAKFVFWAALTGGHLNRLAEAVILFSSAEFGYFELADAFSTGSSLMPQKRNPDVFKLARGKAGTLVGSLAGMLATLKGLPSAYDKDLQEDKLPVFAACDTMLALLPVIADALLTLHVRPDQMRAGIEAGIMATDLADELVRRNAAFREAHQLVGHAVALAVGSEKSLQTLGRGKYLGTSPDLDFDVQSVRQQIEMAKALLAENKG